MALKFVLRCSLFVLLIVLNTIESNAQTSEENLFFDFRTKTSNGWEGLTGWKWMSNLQSSKDQLLGVPNSQGKFPYFLK